MFSDALNHASIIDGARLAVRQGARLHVYRHSDMRHLEDLLLASATRHVGANFSHLAHLLSATPYFPRRRSP